MSILVINTGSSSLKFTLFDDQAKSILIDGQVDWAGKSSELTLRVPGQSEQRISSQATDPASAVPLAIQAATDALAPGETISAIGHRVVHGGTKFLDSTRINEAFESVLDHLTELAPLHNPPALTAIKATESALSGVPEVAVFDTSFFANLPRSAAIYPVPWEWHEKYGIRRFGFHGISHSYCSGLVSDFLESSGADPSKLRLVNCHLGNGCSAAAVQGGVAVGTTMGFTPLDGLMMGTRSGEVDPGILLYLMKEKGISADQVDDALNHASGLLGISGVSGDYRQVEEASKNGNDRATLALEIYAARIKSAIGAFAATMGGLDALVFTAGVGENSASLRQSVCEGLGFLGIELDPGLNAAAQPSQPLEQVDGGIRFISQSANQSPVRVLVVHTRENLMIARQVRKVLGMA